MHRRTSSASKSSIGDDFFNVYRRRKFVECKVTWIDDIDAVFDTEPEFPI